jgi:simple sugar transport system ATP-binding protein
VSGNGQQELAVAISGEERRSPRGSDQICGVKRALAAGRRRRSGFGFVPEERLGMARYLE